MLSPRAPLETARLARSLGRAVSRAAAAVGLSRALVAMAAMGIEHLALQASMAVVGVAAHVASTILFFGRFDCDGNAKSLISVDLAVSALASAIGAVASSSAAIALSLGYSAAFACSVQVATSLAASVLGQALSVFMSAFRLMQWRSECKGLPRLETDRQVLAALVALTAILVVAMSVPVGGSAIVPLPIAGCALEQEDSAQNPYQRFAVFELLTWSLLILMMLALDLAFAGEMRRRRMANAAPDDDEAAAADALNLNLFEVPVRATWFSTAVFVALLLVPALVLALGWTEDTLVLVGGAVGVAVQAARAPVVAMITLRTYLSAQEKAAQRRAREARRKKEIAMAIERRNVKKRKQ